MERFAVVVDKMVKEIFNQRIVCGKITLKYFLRGYCGAGC